LGFPGMSTNLHFLAPNAAPPPPPNKNCGSFFVSLDLSVLIDRGLVIIGEGNFMLHGHFGVTRTIL